MAAGGIVPAMLIRPVPPLRRSGHRRPRGDAWAGERPFILRSALGATVLRMISTHSLSAFTPAIDRTAPAQPSRGAGASAAPDAAVEAVAAPAAQRPLEAVPAQPQRPVPRGSLLDLRV